jgi:ferredoxin
LIAGRQELFSAPPPQAAAEAQRFKDAARERVLQNLSFDAKAAHDWLEQHFDDDFWKDIALRCHGCGACAAVCPTCHCFDIVDEPEGLAGGARRRNWDTCQAGKFTLHASGHNPRPEQNSRFRQRVLHKFAIYPSRFDEILCTGCGRCARVCPAGMDLPEILTRLSQLAAAPARSEGAR